MARPFRPREPLDMPALYLYAVGALARRMRTVAELRRLMRTRVEKGEPGEVKIEAVLTRLLAQRYLDDEAFAADYTRLRQEGAKFGRRRVQQDLQRKGVDSELVTTTLDAAYENVSEDVLARSFLERKRMKPPTNEKESARVMRRLVAAGFALATVYKILKQWNAPEQVLDAVEGIDLDQLGLNDPSRGEVS
jgi:regulatory protein